MQNLQDAKKSIYFFVTYLNLEIVPWSYVGPRALLKQ